MKTALKAVAYIAGFLLMAAGLISIVMYLIGMNRDGDIVTSMPPVETVTTDAGGNTVINNTQQNGTNSATMATPSPFIPTPSPVQTDSVGTTTPEPTPEPTPVPTPEPTPQPQPAGLPVGNGKLSSNTGKWIDVDAVWSAETVDNNKVKVTVTANLRSYRLVTGASHNALELSVGDASTAMDVEALNIETEQEVTTELGTYSFTVNAPVGQLTELPLKANWRFGGTYSGTRLDYITAEGTISIAR